MLSELDQVAIRGYSSIVFFFPGSRHSSMIEVLQAGLSQAAVEMPLLTSAVVSMDQETQRGKLQLRSTDRELVLKVKDVSDGLSYEDLRRFDFPSARLDDSTIMPTIDHSTLRPVVATQANLLRNGLALSVLFHHAAFDAGGLYLLLRIWAQACKRNSTNESVDNNKALVLPPEVFDRRQLSSAPTKTWDPENPDWAKLAQMDWFKCPNIVPVPASIVECAVFTFAPPALAALKHAASPNYCSRPPIKPVQASTNSALKALIWRSIVVARMRCPAEIYDYTLHIPVSVRARLHQALPQDYSGNTALMISVKGAFPPSLTDLKTSMLADLTLKIRQGEQAVNAAYIDDLLSFAKAVPDLERLAKAREAMYAPAVKIFDSSLLNYYGPDWGAELGRIERARPPAQSLTNGGVRLLPRLADGSAEAVIALSPAQIESLKMDPFFMRFATTKHCRKTEAQGGAAADVTLGTVAKL